MTDYATIRKLLNRPVAFHRVFAELSGGATSGLFLSQLWYWHDKTKDPEGWLFKTYEEWKEETCLSRSEIDRARKSLKDLGILEEKKEGIPLRLFYRLDVDALLSLIAESSKQGCSPNEIKFAESSKQACRILQTVTQDPANSNAESCKHIYKDPETTTENTKDYSFTERGKTPNERVRSRHGEIRSLIAERVPDVESFLGWKANKLKTYSLYQNCNVSAAVVLQFYANKLPHWDAISGDSQAVANLIELIEADIVQFAPIGKPAEARKNDLDGIVPEYQNTPEILELNGEEFQGRFGVSLNKFKNHLFENQLL